MGETPEFDEDSDALSEWIVPFSVEIERIEEDLFEKIHRSVASRHVPLVRLGILLDRLHHPAHPQLVAQRVVTALHYAFRPPVEGVVFWGVAKSQAPVEDITGDAALFDGILPNTPTSAPATIGEAIEYLSGDNLLFDSVSAHPSPPFSISAGGLSNEAAYIRDQYAGVQHALSEIAGLVTPETKTILPSDDFIRKATATELCNFVANWVGALHESPEMIGQIVAEFESATPEYGFLGVWVIPRLRRAGRRGVAEMVAIESSGAALLLSLMVYDSLGNVSYQTALNAISPTEENINDVHKAKSDLKGSVAELRLRITTKSGVGYTLAGL